MDPFHQDQLISRMTLIKIYYFNEYMILTTRDLHIFHLLNEFGVLESDTLSKIVSPTSNHKTVSARLLTLKKKWYIKEIGARERMRRKNKTDKKEKKAQQGITKLL